MEKIIDVDNFTELYTEAVKLHNEIMANGNIAANALFEMCRCLKRMRDEGLYTELGFDDFDTYCEEKANIKKRQAYNYIRIYEDLGSGFLQSNAQIGITKLELLTHVPAPDRADFLEKNKPEEISVSELKKRIDELERENGMKGEQLSMLEKDIAERDKTQNDTQEEISDLKNKIAEQEKQLKEKTGKNKAMIDKAVKKAIEKQKDEEKSRISSAVEETRKEYADEIDSYKKKLEQKEASIDSALKKQAELENKLRAAKDNSAAKFRIYFEQINNDLTNLFDAYDMIANIRIKQDYAEKLLALSKMIEENI